MHLLFGFSGRIGRAQWWLAQFAAAGILALCASAILVLDPGRAATPAAAVLGEPAVLLLAGWVLAAAGVKRCHDRDRSGLWLLVALVPLAGALWLAVECGLRPGTPGANAYGDAGGRRAAGALDDLDIAALGRSAAARGRPGAGLGRPTA